MTISTLDARCLSRLTDDQAQGRIREEGDTINSHRGE